MVVVMIFVELGGGLLVFVFCLWWDMIEMIWCVCLVFLEGELEGVWVGMMMVGVSCGNCMVSGFEVWVERGGSWFDMRYVFCDCCEYGLNGVDVFRSR